MTKHGISFTLGSLFTLFVAIIFLNLGLFASGTDLIEDGQHTALNFVNIAHAQSDEQMVSETYPSPAKQLKDGVGMHDIQCNDSRELYIRQSQIPVCLYDQTYDLMQSRGIELVPATPSSSSTGIFTSEEAQWLADNPVIRVSFDPGWTPIEYADESGNLQGIILDYIAEFEAISGADLVPVPAAGTWADALMAVEERNAEIMYMVASTPERLEYMSFTSPHYTIKTSMISLNDTPLNIDDEGLRLITIRSYAIEAWLDENHPDIEYISVDSPADAYALLAAGGADAFTSVWPAATHHAKMSGVDNVYNVGTTGHQYDLTVGYRNDLPLLGSIMQKVLDQIPQEKIDSWYDVTLTLADVDLTPESIVMGVVDDIIALYDSDPENAFEQITSMMATDPSYPFVLDYDTGVIVAHGSNPELVNVLSTSIADLDRPFDVIRSDLLEGHTWVKYTFENPATGTEQVKLSLFVLHDGYIFGSGYYTEHDVTLTLADVDLTPESIVMGVVDDIIALYDSDPENAFEQITSMMATDPSYPFVLDYDTGVIVAHGSNPELVNVLSTSIADLDRPFDVIRSDLLEGHTWVKYTFENPATGTEQVKLSLFVLHDGYIFGSGYYTEHDVTLTLADVDLTPESIVMGVVDDIIALYDSDPENAFEQITSMMATDPSYPFVLDYDTGVIVAHGSNPELVNVLSTSIADLDRPFDVIRSDLLEGHTWVKYTFENPATGTEQVKLSLFVLHDGYIFGSGYYTEHDVTLTLADVDLTPESIVMGVVDDIIALYDSDPENAFEQITSMMATDPSYPFVLDYDTGVIVAHGSNPELVNVLSTSIADLDRPFDVIRSDLLEGHTWVKYTFENPATGTEQVKLSLFVLHDGYIFGSGYYTEHDVTLTLADVDLTPESIVMGVVDDIIALYDSDPENAFEQITSMMATDPSYPFVLDYDTGVIVAHGSNPELVNVLSTSIADLDRPFDVIRSDLLEGHTWVKYTFENPATGTEQVKLSLFVLHDGYIFGSGYYTELTPADIFSPEEVEWLENNPVIRVSFDPGWTPIEYADESGNLQGVTLDYIAEFEAISGADLVPVPAAGTWADALMAVEERNAEIMYMVASAPERLEYMSFTSPHYTVKTTLVSLSNTPLNIDDEGLTLVTINGYAIEAWLDENHPDIEYIPVDSPADAYALLAAGGADAFTSVWPAATHHAKMSGVDNVYNVGTTGHQYDLTVGYRNDLPLLGSIMQKTLDNIPQERIDSWYDAVAQTTDDAETLESVVIGVIDDAIALYDSDPANAFGQITSMELTNPQYPFAMDYLTTQIVAHGAFPERVGEIAVALTESNIPLDVILSDLKKGNVWAEYVFANPSTGIEQTKRSLYVLHEGYIFSSGYYITS